MACKKCALNFEKRRFEENFKNWLFSDHCLCRLFPCISMKLGTFVKWSFLVITNKSTRTCLNIFENSITGFLSGFFQGKSIVMQISFVMLIFLLFSDQISGGSLQGGKLPHGGAPCGKKQVEKHEKVASFPCSHADLFPVFPARAKTRQKVFH